MKTILELPTRSLAVALIIVGASQALNADLRQHPSATAAALPLRLSPAADARFSPGANITFDWSEVSGAASYTIQVDDNNAFPSPFILQQTVTVSQVSTGTLPTLQMWWRVRANDASGNPAIGYQCDALK